MAQKKGAAPPSSSQQRGPGQPEKPIDLKQLAQLCTMQCTDNEIAAFFSVSRKTIERRKQDPEFLAVMDNGKLQGLISLRQAQFKAATGGNTVMMIWLGKQHLAQRDRPVEEEREAATAVEYRWVNPEPPEAAPDPKAASESPKPEARRLQ